VVRLSDVQSRTVGSILGGAFFKTAAVEELETVLRQLTIDWVAVPDGSPLAGNPIGSAEVRRRTGVTILAIVRGHQVLTGPTGEDVVEAGDRIVVAGRRDGVDRLHRMLAPPGAG
jgi:TrkA domain protein